MRSAAIGFVVAFVAGLIALAAVALGQRSTLVYSLGVKPAIPAATLTKGAQACQGPVRPPRETTFDRVGFLLITSGRPGPPVRVEVRDAGSDRTIAAGRLQRGYADYDANDPVEHVVEVGRVHTNAPLQLCLTDEGSKSVSVIGQAGIASPTTAGTLDGTPLTTDLTFNLRSGGSSIASLLPQIAERASRFRAGWISPIVYLLLALGIVVGAPLLLGGGGGGVGGSERA
jgi:hypothetical protein